MALRNGDYGDSLDDGSPDDEKTGSRIKKAPRRIPFFRRGTLVIRCGSIFLFSGSACCSADCSRIQDRALQPDDALEAPAGFGMAVQVLVVDGDREFNTAAADRQDVDLVQGVEIAHLPAGEDFS